MSLGASWIAEYSRGINKVGTRRFKKKAQRRLMRREHRRVIEQELLDWEQATREDLQELLDFEYDVDEQHLIDDFEDMEFEEPYYEEPMYEDHGHYCPVCGEYHE